MQPISPSLRYSSSTLIYVLSIFFERAGYYGLRSILVLFMIKGSLGLAQEEAFQLYGWLTGGLILTQLLGAFLGDLLVGNKAILIVGAVLQATGAFLLCTANLTCLYIAIACICIGGGFYKPNLVSCFGKEFSFKIALRDGGFSILYLAINFAALIGSVLIGVVGNSNFSIGFAMAGALLLMSAILPLFQKDMNFEHVAITPMFSWNFKAIFTVIALVASFWFLFDVLNSAMSLYSFETLASPFEGIHIEQLQTYITSGATLIASVVFAFIWSHYSFNTFTKLAIGFVVAGLASALMVLNVELISGGSIGLFCGSLVALSLAEILIAPFLYSMLMQYIPSKYLAIGVAISLACIQLMSQLSNWVFNSLNEKVIVVFVITTISSIVLGMIAWWLVKRQQRLSMHFNQLETGMDIDSSISDN